MVFEKIIYLNFTSTYFLFTFQIVVGRRPQGTLQGMFASAGSFARIFFPISSGYLVHFTGTTVLFCMLIFIIAFTIIFALYYKKTLEKLSS